MSTYVYLLEFAGLIGFIVIVVIIFRVIIYCNSTTVYNIQVQQPTDNVITDIDIYTVGIGTRDTSTQIVGDNRLL